MTTYTYAYHRAIEFLIYHGSGKRSNPARMMIARALRDLRRDHGRSRAYDERLRLLCLAGGFPGKEI